MNHVYVDESIHERGGFITIALVCAEADLSPSVSHALSTCGFQPGKGEFKSSATMNGDPASQRLRDELKWLLFESGKIAVAFCSINERNRIQEIAIKLLSELPTAFLAPGGVIHFDQGMAVSKCPLPPGWRKEDGCDSRAVGGIQLADCAAHAISTIILAEIGLVNKQVKTHGHYPEPEVDLGWELWSGVRHALASSEPVVEPDAEGYQEPMMQPFGLCITEALPETVRDAVQLRLQAIWVGCIH